MPIKENSFEAWFLASRPKTLAAAVTPVLVGCALACYYGSFDFVLGLLCALFAMLMQVAANLINDLFDYLKGTDGSDRLGPKRAMAQGWISKDAMIKGIFVVVCLAAVCGLLTLPFLECEQLPMMLVVGVFCICFAYFYTSGPFPLSYNGLGDIAVVAFFGVTATCFTAYTQYSKLWDAPLLPTIVGVGTGLAVNTLLVVNNYRDRETDRRDGKNTLVAIFGERFGQWLYLGCGVSAAVCAVAVPFVCESSPYFALVMVLYAFLHFMAYNKLVAIGSGVSLNKLIGVSSRNMLVYALSLAIILVGAGQ